jgi:hypothetical protein
MEEVQDEREKKDGSFTNCSSSTHRTVLEEKTGRDGLCKKATEKG